MDVSFWRRKGALKIWRKPLGGNDDRHVNQSFGFESPTLLLFPTAKILQKKSVAASFLEKNR